MNILFFLYKKNVVRGAFFMLQPILGKNVARPAILDKRLVRELKSLADAEDPYDTVIGKTMCTYDFYEGKIFQF